MLVVLAVLVLVVLVVLVSGQGSSAVKARQRSKYLFHVTNAAVSVFVSANINLIILGGGSLRPLV